MVGRIIFCGGYYSAQYVLLPHLQGKSTPQSESSVSAAEGTAMLDTMRTALDGKEW